MGRFAKKQKPKGKPSRSRGLGLGKRAKKAGRYFKGGGSGEESGGNQVEDIIVEWLIVIVVYAVIFFGFNQTVQSVVLFKDLFTLFGAINYWDMAIGLLVALVVGMGWDVSHEAS